MLFNLWLNIHANLCRNFFFNFWNKLTFLISSTVILAVITYIASDLFYDYEIISIKNINTWIYEYIKILFFIISGYFLTLQKSFSLYGWRKFIQFLYVPPIKIYFMSLLLWLERILFFYVLYLIIARLLNWDVSHLLMSLVLSSLSVTLLDFCFQLPVKILSNKKIILSKNYPRIFFLVSFRFSQILKRKNLNQLLLLIATICSLIFPLHNNTNLIFLYSTLSGLFLGNLLVIILSLQLQDDAQSNWLDIQLGISHESIIRCYYFLGFILNAVFFILFLLGVLAFSNSSTSILHFFVSVMIPIVIYPSIMLQIDPKHGWVSCLIVFFLSFFSATGFLIHPLWLFATFVFVMFALYYQGNRFYRSFDYGS